VEALLGDIAAWMAELPAGWVYVTVFVVAYLENVIPPIPGDMVVVFGGYLVGIGAVAFVPTALLATVGGAFGFMTMYAVGWRIGLAVEDPDRLRWIPRTASDRVRGWVHRYGYGVVAGNRFLSGARSVISLTVGAARMDPAQTAVWATVSSALWCVLLVALGYMVGDNWAEIGEWLRIYGLWVGSGLGLAALAAAVRWAWRRRSGEDPAGGDSEGPER